MRFLALNLPTFAVDHARLRAPQARDPRTLFLLFDVIRGARWIAECSPEAARLGVRRGMSLAHARALIGTREVVVEPFDPVSTQEKLEELSDWAVRFSPHVCPDPPDGLLLDVSGSERVFGGEGRLLEHVVEGFEARAFRARACVASTIGCAWAGARFARETCTRVPAGGESEILAPFPAEALRLEPEVVDALAEIGIERIAELYELPRESLPARFGGDLLLRLDQALGEAFEAFSPLEPRTFPRAARSFEAPVGLEVVAYTLRGLLRELIGELESLGEAALALEFELTCSESEPVHEQIVLSGPHRDFEHFWSLIAPLLERVQLGFGVEHIALAMPRTVASVGRQVTAWGTTPEGARPSRALAELLDTLASRLGRECILGVEAVESHLPERAFRTLPCSEAWELGRGKGPARRSGQTSGITTLPRPSRLFEPPERIEVESEAAGERAGAPVRFHWRGEARGVVRRFGPERIAVPWWQAGGTSGARDYFCVEDQCGRWFWLVLEVNGRWMLHGEWL